MSILDLTSLELSQLNPESTDELCLREIQVPFVVVDEINSNMRRIEPVRFTAVHVAEIRRLFNELFDATQNALFFAEPSEVEKNVISFLFPSPVKAQYKVLGSVGHWSNRTESPCRNLLLSLGTDLPAQVNEARKSMPQRHRAASYLVSGGTAFVLDLHLIIGSTAHLTEAELDVLHFSKAEPFIYIEAAYVYSPFTLKMLLGVKYVPFK